MEKNKKLKNLTQLCETHPKLGKLYISYYQKLSRENFLDELCGHILDLIDMEERVQLFMSTCTDLSYTNYDLDVIKGLIHTKELKNISEFCKDLLEDHVDNNEMLEYIKLTAMGQ
jgi:hypothetical protein